MHTTASATGALTDDHVIAVGEGLLARSWPGSQWRHPEHVIATVYLLRCRPDLTLETALPELIKTYNLSQGGENTDSRGYHHTITMFYLAEIRAFLAGLEPDVSLADACARLMASPVGSKDYVLTRYSAARLFTPEARLGLIEPDAAAPADAYTSGAVAGREPVANEAAQ